MELWIPITVFAAFSQNLRSALQKNLKQVLSTWGSTAARFVFAAPLALLLFAGLVLARGNTVPAIGANFAAFSVVGGICQIVATGLLIHIFSYQNFSVATAFTKTEPIQTALFGIVLLGDRLSPGVAVAIMVSLLGVILISLPRDREKGGRWLDPTIWMGIASGGLFGLSAVAYRGASLSLASGDVALRASMTLAFVTTVQALLVLGWLRWREAGQVSKLFHHWRAAGLVGLVGMLGSLAWFTAFTLENAAHVRAVGQIEVVFMIAASVFFFRERVSLREITGVLLVSAGILGLILFSG